MVFGITCSAIDLIIVDPILYLDYSWHVQDDRTDHFPIIVQYQGPTIEEHGGNWKFTKADWSAFKELCLELIKYELYEDDENILLRIQ